MGSQYIDWRSNFAWQSIGIDLIHRHAKPRLSDAAASLAGCVPSMNCPVNVVAAFKKCGLFKNSRGLVLYFVRWKPAAAHFNWELSCWDA